MNKDNAHLFLPLVQALADGKEIQQSSGDKWKSHKSYSFGFNPEYYRIKPEPVEVKLWVDDSTNEPDLKLGYSRLPLGTTNDGVTVRLFREVL